jgi:predicted PurR-regulated permease PerM
VSDAQNSTGELVKEGLAWSAVFVRSLWSGGEAILSLFSLLVVTPIVAFYLISDWPRMLKTIDALIPVPHRETVRMLALQINQVISGYFRGQTLVALILGLYFSLTLTAIGVNFGLLLGIASGLLTLIPYVGSLTGLVIGVSVAIAQFWPDYTPIVMVLAVFLVGQFLEGHVLSPKLVGGRVGLHPVWLMFALLSFGYLFGFVGLLIAVPAAAVAGVLIRFALRWYLASPYYTGTEAGPELIEATRLELR